MTQPHSFAFSNGAYDQDFLDSLLEKNGFENPAIWAKTLDLEPLELEISDEIKSYFDDDQEALDMIQREILDNRIIILRAIFNLIFNNGLHPKRVVRNIFILAKNYYPQCLSKLTESQLALLTDDTSSAMSMRSKTMNKRLKTASKELQKEIIADMDRESLRFLSTDSYAGRAKKNKKLKKTRKPTRQKRKEPITPELPGLNQF